MPKIHNHHFYGRMCHQGENRTGMRMPHKYHVSYKPNQGVAVGYTKSTPAKVSTHEGDKKYKN